MPEKIVCVVGPTASGKTALAVRIAKEVGGEVVGCDSMQIYRGMGIGSAAPTEEEREGVPHHMVAVADPREPWSAARYVEAASPVVDGILARGKVPIVAGGSGLWMDALVRGRVFAPGRDGGAVRRGLEARLAAEGTAPLMEELRAVDPDAAARIHPSDAKRIVRALEVWRESGQTITEHDRADAARPPRYEAVKIGLRYRDRADLYAAIDRRVGRMLEAGLLEEVRALTELGPGPTALQAIGYKELLPVLRGEEDLEEAAEEIRRHTRQYAKRQLTWWRKDPAVHWIDRERDEDLSAALQISTGILISSGVY